MLFRLRILALVASIISNTLAQTPQDFSPGTLVKLGVAFPSINIDPVGSALQSLDQAKSQPVISVPMANLVGRNGQVDPQQRFMVMMIDTDVVQQNIRTTVLHWFQPDLVIDTTSQGGIMPQSAPGTNASSLVTQALSGNMTRLVKSSTQSSVGQTNYLPPGPPPGPAHRYVQVLFAQPSNFSVPACFQNVLSKGGNSTEQRLGFDINQFLAATNVVTRPIAGNYFRAQNPQPGSLVVNTIGTGLVNARCPGVTVAGQGMPAGAKRWIG
ncbi:uncharacterized protein PV09_04388 [Verruconis gallopava]|uniref:Phosphatidylethanolamine-binding protein n=1 Tax=Verruconis gallopava TaxID=253628 RepID=A0A0D2ACL9_9PEZI|nr:uncharacterized protein PV09_04388 [Verruconis gallopava]KIW04643.1 hypothetical protein PV09_04388 [Verruconis gallopava]